MERYNKIFKKHEKYINKNPDLAEALGEMYKIYQDGESLRSMFIHDIGGNLTGTDAICKLLLKKELPKEVREDIKRIKSYNKRNLSTHGLVRLSKYSKRELQRNSDYIELENIAKEQALNHDLYMKDKKIGFVLKFNREEPDRTPIEIYAFKPVIDTMLGTLLQNSLDHSPQNTKIKQGIKINRSNKLELLSENAYSDKRRNHFGMGKGLGIPFVRDITETLGGKFSIHHSSKLDKDYDIVENFGHNVRKNETNNYKLFGVRISIPMSELTKPSRK